MTLPKLSIILPVYNTEKYLKKCLESIFNSSFKDFELIIINNATKDNAEQIILEFKEKYKDKIKYLKRDNNDISAARNLGIETATAIYTTFIDSDDYIEPNMLELMVEKMENGNFDVVACDINIVYDGINKINSISSGYNEDVFNKEKIKETLLFHYPVMWNKIYRTELVKKVEFTSGVWYEDMEYLLRLYPLIKSIGVVKKPLYNYLQRKNSITYTYNHKVYDIINNMTKVIQFYQENNIYEEYEEVLEYLYVRYAFATFPKRLAKCRDKKKYEQGIDFAFKKVKEYFPNYSANKYLSKTGVKGKYIKHFNKFLSYLNYVVQISRKYN